MEVAEFTKIKVNKIPHLIKLRDLSSYTPESFDTTKETKDFKPLFNIPWVDCCFIKKSFSFIIDLAELMDNLIALYDRNVVITATELKMIKKELIQHRAAQWCSG